LASLRSKAFGSALSDAETIMPSVQPTEKALFREAQALYGLKKF